MDREGGEESNEVRDEENKGQTRRQEGVWERARGLNFNYGVHRGLSPKQNKANVDVSNESFIKRSKVREVTQTNSPHLWIAPLISCNTRVASTGFLAMIQDGILKQAVYIKKVSWGRDRWRRMKRPSEQQQHSSQNTHMHTHTRLSVLWIFNLFKSPCLRTVGRRIRAQTHTHSQTQSFTASLTKHTRYQNTCWNTNEAETRLRKVSEIQNTTRPEFKCQTVSGADKSV